MIEITQDELDGMLSSMYEQSVSQAEGETQETVTVTDAPDTTLVEAVNTSNYILAGIVFFIGILVGVLCIKILWERIK